jgi:hypothetical protein
MGVDIHISFLRFGSRGDVLRHLRVPGYPTYKCEKNQTAFRTSFVGLHKVFFKREERRHFWQAYLEVASMSESSSQFFLASLSPHLHNDFFFNFLSMCLSFQLLTIRQDKHEWFNNQNQVPIGTRFCVG